MILLALGSNLTSKFGNRFKNIELAMIYLEKDNIKILEKSSFYETPSYPDKNSPKFINAVIKVETNLTPENLASKLILIENILGRKRNKKNDPRTLDIDIIDYNGKVVNFTYKDLIFKAPHEKLIYRNFVLFPLQEIAPKWTHPITKDSIDVLISKLSTDEKNSILKIKKP